MRRTSLILFLSLVLTGGTALAQSAPVGVLYKNEFSYGILLHTKGVGGSFQLAKHVGSADKLRLFDINLYQLKHPKEFKESNPLIPESSPYAYGKMNSLYVLKVNYGFRRVIADKSTPQSVRVNWNFTAGPILGFLKPIYYDLRTNEGDNFEQKRFDDILASNRDTASILGQSPFTKGLGQTKLIWGGNIKTSFSFEWGKYDYKFYSLETGVMVDAFPVDVPIFVGPPLIKNNLNQKAYVNLFLALSFGSRK